MTVNKLQSEDSDQTAKNSSSETASLDSSSILNQNNKYTTLHGMNMYTLQQISDAYSPPLIFPYQSHPPYVFPEVIDGKEYTQWSIARRYFKKEGMSDGEAFEALKEHNKKVGNPITHQDQKVLLPRPFGGRYFVYRDDFESWSDFARRYPDSQYTREAVLGHSKKFESGKKYHLPASTDELKAESEAKADSLENVISKMHETVAGKDETIEELIQLMHAVNAFFREYATFMFNEYLYLEQNLEQLMLVTRQNFDFRHFDFRTQIGALSKQYFKSGVNTFKPVASAKQYSKEIAKQFSFDSQLKVVGTKQGFVKNLKVRNVPFGRLPSKLMQVGYIAVIDLVITGLTEYVFGHEPTNASSIRYARSYLEDLKGQRDAMSKSFRTSMNSSMKAISGALKTQLENLHESGKLGAAEVESLTKMFREEAAELMEKNQSVENDISAGDLSIAAPIIENWVVRNAGNHRNAVESNRIGQYIDQTAEWQEGVRIANQQRKLKKKPAFSSRDDQLTNHPNLAHVQTFMQLAKMGLKVPASIQKDYSSEPNKKGVTPLPSVLHLKFTDVKNAKQLIWYSKQHFGIMDNAREFSDDKIFKELTDGRFIDNAMSDQQMQSHITKNAKSDETFVTVALKTENINGTTYLEEILFKFNYGEITKFARINP